LRFHIFSRTTLISGARRHHYIFENRLQRAVWAADKLAGIDKQVFCHVLHHSFCHACLGEGLRYPNGHSRAQEAALECKEPIGSLRSGVTMSTALASGLQLNGKNADAEHDRSAFRHFESYVHRRTLSHSKSPRLLKRDILKMHKLSAKLQIYDLLKLRRGTRIR
jgi:hypothetical protein